MKTAYDGQLKIWVVGVRQKMVRRRSIWSGLWTPTSLKWFMTRADCWKYIDEEISAYQKEYYDYKPLRYGPVEK